MLAAYVESLNQPGRTCKDVSISCDRGVYRWHMRAWFTSSKTTYWSTSSPFYMAGV
jgi:hypothetical protein